jgi:hypothetical protein
VSAQLGNLTFRTEQLAPQNDACPAVPKAPVGKATVDANIQDALFQQKVDDLDPFTPNIPPFSQAPNFVSEVAPFGPQDYKRSAPGKGADVFGNFNFGAVGAANGWSLKALLRGSLAAQIFENAIHGKLKFSDNSDDPAVIAQGYKYFVN